MSLGAQAGTVTEDAATTASPTDPHSATGTIAFNDVDLSDTHTASFVAAPGNATALGNFALASVIEVANAANGTVNWTYTLNNAAAQSLAQGQTASETYVVTVSDGHGSSTTQNVTITITGTNDQVQITSGVQTGDAKEDSGDYAASGNITFTDADLIDTHSVTVTPGASGYLGSFTTDPLNDSTGTGSGSLGWHFAVDNAALQFLGEGQIVTQTYNVAIGDGAVQTVTITITGTNDRPTLTIADTTGAMSEGNAAATLSDSGALSFADLDNIDAVTVSHTANGNIAWSGGTLDAGVASALVAGFSVDQNSWDYSSSQNLDFLGAGETITFSYRVVATDNSGAANAASATQTVSITITGSNDAPVLSFATGNDAGAAQEDTTLSVSGQFSSTDIDHAATATWGIVGANTGSFGSIAVDSTGQWTYTLANGTDGVASAVQSLKAGESHDEVFSVQVSDGLGGVDTQLVTVTVTGSNDAPVLSFATDNDAGTVKEDTTLSVNGQFSSADIDYDATASWSINGSPTGTYGSIAVDSTGQWTYTLANGTDGVASAVQSLKAGESHDEVFSVQVSDGLGGVDTQLVTVTVTGSNDAPVLSFAPGNDLGAVKEDSTLSVSGQFSSTDIDHAATATWSIAGSNTGSFGSIAVDSNGQWTYTLANGTDGVASAVQSLKAGESHDEVFSVQVSDGLGGVDTQLVTVTVTGSNDAPVLSFAPGNDLGAVQEDSTLSVSGQFSSTDIDHAATATWSIVGANTGSYGSIIVDGTGQWTYPLANSTDGVASAVQSLKAGESHDEVFSVQVSDGLGGVDIQQVTVTVTGSNDAPVLNFATGNDAGAVKEDTTLSVNGQFSSTDIDHDATAIWSIVGANTGSFGSIAVDSNGQWTYTLANSTDGVASAVQSLKAGESHDEVFSVQVSDGLGGVDTQLVTVTVTGSNDAPVISFASGGDAGAVKEDTTLSVSGQFNSTDIDHDATATWSIVGANTGSFGSIAVDSNGQWTYTLANGTDGVASAVQSLKAGESHDEVFSVQVSDGLGGVDTQLVTVTVTGSNDQPTLTIADTAGAMNEGDGTATLSDSGALSFADVDNTDTVTVSHTANGDIAWSGGTLNAGVASALVAGFSVDQNSWDYSSSQNLDFLGAGETITFSYTVVATDDSGAANAASATQTVTITLTGTNDQPTLTITDTAGAMNEGNGTATLSDSGALSFADLDSTDAVTVSHTANGDIAWSGGTLNAGMASALVAGFSVDQNSWDYSSNQNLDFLGSGETITFSYTVVATDDSGAANAASATQTVTITLTGTNDQPTLTIADTTGTMNEGNGTATLSDSGALSFSDLDSTDVVTVSHTANGDIAWSGGTLNAGVASALVAGFSVDQNSWDYSSSQNLDFLGAGETITFSYTVVATDDSGAANAASATQTVTITLTGTNDQPTLTIADTAGAMNEGNGTATLSDSGALSFADVDNTDTVTVSHTANGDIAWSGGTLNAGVASALVAGFSVDQNSWDYSSSQNLDFLGSGETITFSYTVVATDDSGAANAASATQTVTITLTGTNDQPTLTIADTTGTMNEGNGTATLSDSGALSFSDLDSTDVVTVSHTANGDIAWSGGTLNAGVASALVSGFSVDQNSWDYSSNQNLDFLGSGETITFSYTVVATDDSGAANAASATQTVSITITGSNDTPMISFASSNDVGAVQEDTTLSVSGQFSSTDIDHNATATWSIVGANTGSFGSIAVDSNGQWTYTLANSTDGVASAVQSLKAGESHDEVFSVQVSDGIGGVDTQLVTVTVTGSNDAPVLSFASGNDAGAVQEDSTLSISGQFSSADIDHNATATWSIAGANTGSYGSIIVDGTGQWTYTLANGSDGVASAVQSLKAGESHDEVFSVQVSDGLGGVDTQLVTVTVTGSNDAPVLSFAPGNDAGAVQEDTTLSVSGQFSSTDIDHDATATWSIAGSNTGSYGSIAVDSTGQWTYTLANGTDGVANAVQSLKAGESHDEVFSVQVSDGLGGVDTQLVTVTVTGSNDAPVLSFASGNDAGAVQEDTTLSVSGQFSSTDIDHAATATWSIAGSNTGTYGSIAVEGTGQWTYTLANGTDGVASAVQSLKAGESHDEVFSVQVSDGLGGVDTQLVTVTVTGSNDAAVLSSASVTLSETNAPLTTGGNLTVSDIDSPENFQAQTDTAGNYGKFSIGTGGAWTYTADSAHNEFAAGTTYTDTFAVSSADGTLTSVTVHILGTNDAALLSAGIANLTETNAATDISTAGSLTISDVDSPENFQAQTNTAGSYGKFSIGTGGAWTYVADSAHNEFAAGTTYTDTFAVSSADGTLTSVTVHILGTNDAAVLSAGIANLTETNAAVDISTAGTLTISDVDSAATFVAQTNTAGSYGKFSIGTGGAWTYTADSAHNEFVAGTTYTDTFTVSSADGTLTSVTVHILGTNDAAVLSTGIANLTETNAVDDISTAGTLTISDVDSAATFVAQTNTAGSYGKFSIGAGGAWTYTADSAHNEFAAGTTYTDTFAVSSADGTLTSVTVHIAGSNDSPTITSNGGGTTASINVTENTAAVTTVVATDVDLPAQTLSYSIVGGADAAKFSIVSGTGALSFIAAPNFEAPTDSGTNNIYDVIVRASDGTLFDDQAIAVTVTGVNDNSPVITSNGGGATASVNVAENTTAVTTVVATDADLPAQTLSYSILNTAGTDFGKFSISSSGVLTFNSAPDYENPQDIGGTGGDNAYVVDVQVTDGNGGTDTQTLTVNVQNVVETPVDSVPPTVTVTGTALGSSIGSTSTVTFQFRETVSGFNLSDVSVTTTSGVPRGTFSNFTQVDGDTYTATLTRTQGGSLKVDVAANSYTDLAGNPGAAGSSANLPAGVAGEPINLALNIPLAEINGPVTVAISGVPSGWVFNAGTDNGDGTWTVQTNDPGALTVTSPGDFAGALVLDVNLYWSNSDGSSASAYVFNNVEVYAPGSPVFALSADDNLSGSSGADTFVFAQPIGNNQIYNFDVTADKIDLIGFTGVTAFADLSISNDANGNALVSIGSGQTVTLKGVDAADLSEANFQFDRDPLTSNSGTLTIADGAIMPFGGSIDNSGSIELGSAGNETRLEILFRGATLSGGGQVLLSDNAQNVIFGGSADTMLTNIDNRISGAGQLGAGQMILANAGLILASGLNSLVLDTGTHTITNSGVLESTGTGGMTVASTVENTGHLWANGGDLHLLADVTGNGSATIDGDASLTFAGAAHTSVAFHGEGAGSLVIAQAEAAGSLVGILGLESDDMLTFGNLAFGANTQLSYNANASGAGGLLTVDDGAHRAEVNLLGHYSAEDFQITDGGEAGTQVSYHGESSGTLVGSMLADTLSGGDGNDIIVGRGGEDTLSGGAGADVFAYLNANEGGDHILDYNYAEGDTVDLSALLNANFVSGTSQVADFVQLAQSGSDITVQVDPDGANNGKHFVDVAVLDHTGTPGPDLVRTWFGEADHTLTA
ncbi:VCBS domain-containing protein [Pseudomonas chlororaphis]|uniref:VCBS domain-containing protein n=1 Tax=Pseudomonas chlororaphis TaxID=587753 RepID=UPI0013DD9650|nr:VCBS domain-containing protein [Pseudomonas chlororaphis]